MSSSASASASASSRKEVVVCPIRLVASEAVLSLSSESRS